MNKRRNPTRNRRVVGIMLFILALIILLIFIVRFSYIIITDKVSGQSLGEMTERLYQGSATVKAKRGSILDRNGEVIAEDATSYSVYAVLDKTYKLGDEELYVQSSNINEIASILNQVVGISKDTVVDQLNPDDTDTKQVEFGTKGKNISLVDKNKIQAALDKAKIKGIYFSEHPRRIYPNGVFASNLIGYADLEDKDDESKGLSGVNGLEKQYNDLLTGKEGKIIYQKNNSGGIMPGTTVVEKEAQDGQDIKTTLDISIQNRLEELMTEAYEEQEPTDMMAILVEAKTGDILAASQRPTFDPETRDGLDDEKQGVWQNLLVEDTYEPGSTMKVFTVGAAIQDGKFNENSTVTTGTYSVDGISINDWNTGGIGTVSYRKAFAWSSNVAMVHLEEAMGNYWQTSLKNFGFGKSTDSGLTGEQDGTIQASTNVDKAMTAFGQAISVTAFQMMQGYTAVGNEGNMLKLRYVSSFNNTAENKITEVKKETVGTPISSDTASEVLSLMQDVVEDDDGTGSAYAIDGYDVAAKTGTSQIAENGEYLTGEYDYIYSVVQMVPAEDPEYIMYVTMKQPQNIAYGRTPADVIADISNGTLKRALDSGIADK